MRRPRAALVLVVGALVALSLACSGGSSGGSDPEDTGGAPGPDDTAGGGGEDTGAPADGLRCAREGYPCTLGDADPVALERALALAAEAAARLGAGQSGRTAAEDLALEADLVELWADHDALVFRLVGTPPISVGDPRRAWADAAAGGPGAAPPPPPDVVGPQGGPRSALILDSIASELIDMGLTPTGQSAAALIGLHPDYDGRVTLRATSPGNPSLPLAAWDDLDDFDLVLYEGHGKQLCACPDALVPLEDCDAPDPAACLTHLFVGLADDYGPEIESRPGVSLAVTPLGTRWVTLSSDFFFDTWPAGLDDALVLVNACESQRGEDLGKALTGPGTATLGWTESVYGEDVARVTDALLGRMLDLGLDSAEALRQLGEEGALVGRAAPEAEAPRFVAHRDSAPVRAREVIHVTHPDEAFALVDGATLPLDGVAGDGVPDALRVGVRVEGVAEGTAGDAVLRVSVAGAQVERALDLGESPVPGEWWHDVTVDLGRDVAPGESLLVKGVVDLPEGGASEHVVEVQPTGLLVTFDTELSGSGELGAFSARWTGEADLLWDAGQSAWVGTGPLEYAEASVSAGVPDCSVTGLSTTNGTLAVRRLLWTGVASETVATFWPRDGGEAELVETFTLFCPGIGPGGTDIRLPQSGAWALGAFLSAHQLELDEVADGFVIGGFSDPGEPGVLARWTVSRTVVVEGAPLTEDTQLTLRQR